MAQAEAQANKLAAERVAAGGAACTPPRSAVPSAAAPVPRHRGRARASSLRRSSRRLGAARHATAIALAARAERAAGARGARGVRPRTSRRAEEPLDVPPVARARRARGGGGRASTSTARTWCRRRAPAPRPTAGDGDAKRSAPPPAPPHKARRRRLDRGGACPGRGARRRCQELCFPEASRPRERCERLPIGALRMRIWAAGRIEQPSRSRSSPRQSRCSRLVRPPAGGPSTSRNDVRAVATVEIAKALCAPRTPRAEASLFTRRRARADGAGRRDAAATAAGCAEPALSATIPRVVRHVRACRHRRRATIAGQKTAGGTARAARRRPARGPPRRLPSPSTTLAMVVETNVARHRRRQPPRRGATRAAERARTPPSTCAIVRRRAASANRAARRRR